MDDTVCGRIRDDDDLIVLDKAREIMGGISVSTAYCDAELMALKIPMTAGKRKTKMVRFIRREILELRAQRVALAEANAANIKAEVEARVERRRARQRLRWAERIKPKAEPVAIKSKPKAKAEGLPR